MAKVSSEDAFGPEHPFDGVQGRNGFGAREHEGPPRHAEGDPQGGFVGAVSADVSHGDANGSVFELDGVEEVTTQEGPPPSGLVADGPLEAGIVDDRAGHQAAFHAGALGLEQQCLPQLPGRLLALAPGDGVADRPGQRLVVHPTFDEVVLGAEQHGLGRHGPVGESGEDHHGGTRRVPDDRPDGIEAGHVGEAEVHQDAVRPLLELPQTVGQVATPDELVATAGQLEQLPDEEGVARIVLHQHDPEGGDRRHAGGIAHLGRPVPDADRVVASGVTGRVVPMGVDQLRHGDPGRE